MPLKVCLGRSERIEILWGRREDPCPSYSGDLFSSHDRPSCGCRTGPGQRRGNRQANSLPHSGRCQGHRDLERCTALMLSPGASGERAYRQRHAVKRISMRLRNVRYSTMSGLLKSGSETYRMTAAQRALVPPCVSPRSVPVLHLDVVGPAGPDGSMLRSAATAGTQQSSASC